MKDKTRWAKKILGSIALSFYATFVLQQLWNWFIVPALHVDPASYWLIFGINTLFGLLRGEFSQEANNKITFMALDACIPDEKREEINNQLNGAVVENIAIRAFSNTMALAIGWAVHTFLL